MTAPVVARDDAQARAAVWITLGDLYLDTQMMPHAYEYMAQTLAASPYGIEALHRILVDEVHPALHANLMQVAGEWAGFDEDWLVARVREVCARPLWRRRLSRLSLDLVRHAWRIVEARIRALRQA